MNPLSRLAHRLLSSTVAPHPETRRATARPAVELLEDRVVPAGLPLDLTTPGSSGQVGAAIFQQTDEQPTGTGVINSFLRIQGQGAKQTVEQGYNTDARPLQFDEKSSAQFTRSLQLEDIPTVRVEGTRYREFLLDVNESSKNPLISLDELRLYVADVPNLKGYNKTTGQLALRDPIYDLDALGDRYIKIDYRLNSGSGSGDVIVLIPDQLFSGAGSNPYVYLYSKFGATYGSDAGFEEWAVREGADEPEVNTGSLSGFVIFSATEEPLAGIGLVLRDEQNNVIATATTDDTGFYKFSTLAAGVYSIEAADTLIYDNETATAGTINDTTNGTSNDFDAITGITLGDGENGVFYNFTLTLFE